jgi:hypothetical protein
MWVLGPYLNEQQREAMELAVQSSGLTEAEFLVAALRYAVMDTARGGNVVRATAAIKGTPWPLDATGVAFANQLTRAK